MSNDTTALSRAMHLLPWDNDDLYATLEYANAELLAMHAVMSAARSLKCAEQGCDCEIGKSLAAYDAEIEGQK